MEQIDGIDSFGSVFLGYNFIVLFENEKEKYKTTVALWFLYSPKAIMTGCLSIQAVSWAGWMGSSIHSLAVWTVIYLVTTKARLWDSKRSPITWSVSLLMGQIIKFFKRINRTILEVMCHEDN